MATKINRRTFISGAAAGTVVALKPSVVFGTESNSKIEVGNQTVVGKFPGTADWDDYQNAVIGSVRMKETGAQTIKFRANAPKTWKPMNLVSMTLKRTN